MVTIAVPASTEPGFYHLSVDLVRPQAISFEVVGAFRQVVADPPGPFPAGTSPTTVRGPLTSTSRRSTSRPSAP